MGAALHARADDQERAGGVGGQQARRQQRERGGAAGRHGRPVQPEEPPPGAGLEDQDFGLHAGQALGRVLGMDRDQLGDRQRIVRRGHEQEDAAPGQGHG
jgi:hypothetical protein